MSEPGIDQIVSREVESFRAYLKADKKCRTTIRLYTEAIAQLLRVCGKDPKDLTPEDLQSFKAFLSERYCENAMYTRIVAANQYTDKMLHRSDLKVRPPKMVNVSKISLTEDEIKAIQKSSSSSGFGKRNRALIDVMYYGGLRVAEVAQLTLSCLDLDKNRLRVNAGKGKNYDMVNLAPEAVQSLRDYITNGRPQPRKGAEAHLFLGRDGGPLSKTQIWKTTKVAAQDAGITKNVHPHIFRHSMITHMAEKGLSASFIQAQSRHKSLDQVARYTHLSEKAVRTAYDSVFTPEKPIEPARPIPQPAPVRPQDAAYAAPRLTHEDILRARLEGKIDTPTMEAMLAHIEQASSGPIPKAPRTSIGYC